MKKTVIVTNANFRVNMKAYDGTVITAFTTTKVQARHTKEMYGEITEKGQIKYRISIKKLKK
jgi:hypothetical protein